MAELLDSGTRREFESGAVRDICEGKGRCDLLPLDVVALYIDDDPELTDFVLWHINLFQQYGQEHYLFGALNEFSKKQPEWHDRFTMILEVAKQFEDGAVKYGDDNWRKGIPVRCYIDSAVRHYLKFLRGDQDEPHDRAFCWNILCAIWTCKHKPELNDYAEKLSNHIHRWNKWCEENADKFTRTQDISADNIRAALKRAEENPSNLD